MNKQYIRNGLEYYMKVEAMGGEEYEYQMLTKNTIPNLLALQSEQVNQKQYFIYKASGLKPFWIISEKMWISGQQLHSIVDSLLAVMKELDRYLLTADNLVLEPDCLFLDLDNFQLKFLYLPGYEHNILKQMAKLMEYLLGKIDYEDSEGVVFAYGMYRILKEPIVNLEELQNFAGQRSQEKKHPEEGKAPLVMPEHTVKQAFSWGLKLSGILWILLGMGVGATLFLIYGYGIQIWKRNLLLCLGVGLLSDSMVFGFFLQKREREKEIAEAFRVANHRDIPLVGYVDLQEEEQSGNQETMMLSFAEEKKDIRVVDRIGKLIEIGEGNTNEIIINKMIFVIGSYSMGVDYCLKDRQISRFHATVLKKEGEFYIKDLHSKNGTFVNEERVEPEKERKIQNNDWIRLADLRFRFVLHPSPIK